MLHIAALIHTLATTAANRMSVRGRQARAVSMLEYVLIAAVVLVVVAVFREGFVRAVRSLIEEIESAIGNTSG